MLYVHVTIPTPSPIVTALLHFQHKQGLNLPEVSLVCILDADAEGFLRSDTALLQTIGRVTRHQAGRAVLYADRITPSMKRALAETDRRRDIQRR